MGRIVIACYKPKPNKENELQEIVKQHIGSLRSQGLVTDGIHALLKAKDGTLVEIFEWVSIEAIESSHTNPVVTEIWRQLSEVCDYVPIGNLQEASQIFSEFVPVND
jgi:quinol monooxygenase YgiN